MADKDAIEKREGLMEKAPPRQELASWDKKDSRIVFAFLVIFAFATYVFIKGPPDSAQKAERGTQQWKLPIDGEASVHVVDTTGVCLYVVYAYAASPSPAIAAVPKTQLPQGAGCQ